MTGEDFRRNEISKTNAKLDSIEKTVLLINVNMGNHITSQNQANDRVAINFQKLENEIKDQRQHFDRTINDNRTHFDSRITSCNASLNKKLNEDYMTKAQIHAKHESEVIIQMDKRQKEMKEVRKEITKEVNEKVGSLKKLLYGILIVTISVVGIVVSFFKGSP